MKSLLAALLLAVLALAIPLPGNAQGKRVAGVPARCNAQMLNELQEQVRNDDRHGPGGSAADAQKRYAELAQILNSLSEERGILENVCQTDAEKAPLFGQLGATAGWTLALASDLVPRLLTCPAAIHGLQSTMLGQAWLNLATVVNHDTGGTVPPSIAEVQPKIESRAKTVDLTLPSLKDTSAYWLSQLTRQGQLEAGTCPSPSPSPGASASPAPALSPP